jgi:glutamine amidotransferase
MCRLLGIVSSEPVDFRVLLAEGRRSLQSLGQEHDDGWGLASCSAGSWDVHKGTRPAPRDDRFRRRAAGARGEVLVSHVRKRTVGSTRKENTHPFVSGRWVFAHNGTITGTADVRRGVSKARAAEIHGDTDSEVFFAYLLTELDRAGLSGERAGPDTDVLLGRVAADCRARAGFGSFNFLLSDGESCYVHRFGRGLYLLERGVRETGRRARAAFVASEPMTDEPWLEIHDGTLLRVESDGTPIAIGLDGATWTGTSPCPPARFWR